MRKPKMPLSYWIELSMGIKDECWPWQGNLSVDGYARYSGKFADRMIYRMYVGSLADNEEIRHTCDNPSCVNWNHFLKGSSQDNSDDMVARGRQRKGITVAGARLDEDDVFDIREMAASGHFTQKAIAAIYDVSPATISLIVNHITWK